MVPEKYGLAAVAQHLLALFEVRRPGIARWDAQAETFLRREADEALDQMERQCRELGVDDPPHWQRARAVAKEVLIPRYARLAQVENAAAGRDYGMWRGGDLIARGAFALSGLVLGGLFVLGPFLPDGYAWWYRRSYRKKLDALVADLAREGASLEAYRPISEVQRSLGLRGEADGSANESSDRAPVAAPQIRSKG